MSVLISKCNAIVPDKGNFSTRDMTNEDNWQGHLKTGTGITCTWLSEFIILCIGESRHSLLKIYL